MKNNFRVGTRTEKKNGKIITYTFPIIGEAEANYLPDWQPVDEHGPMPYEHYVLMKEKEISKLKNLSLWEFIKMKVSRG